MIGCVDENCAVIDASSSLHVSFPRWRESGRLGPNIWIPAAARMTEYKVGDIGLDVVHLVDGSRIVSARCASGLFSKRFVGNDLEALDGPKWANIELNCKIR